MIATILLVAAIALVLIDLFIPTSGLFLILSALAALGSILFAFRSSTSAGLTFIILVLGSLPVLIALFLKVWPHTAIGKKLLGRKPLPSEYQWSSAQDVQNVKSLVGCTGKTVTEMMPSGIVEIDGKRFESLTEGRTVGAGRTVRVLRIEMGRLVVAESEGFSGVPSKTEVPQSTSSYDQEANRKGEVATGNDSAGSGGAKKPKPSLLDQSIDEFGLESISDQDS